MRRTEAEDWAGWPTHYQSQIRMKWSERGDWFCCFMRRGNCLDDMNRIGWAGSGWLADDRCTINLGRGNEKKNDWRRSEARIREQSNQGQEQDYLSGSEKVRKNRRHYFLYCRNILQRAFGQVWSTSLNALRLLYGIHPVKTTGNERQHACSSMPSNLIE